MGSGDWEALPEEALWALSPADRFELIRQRKWQNSQMFAASHRLFPQRYSAPSKNHNWPMLSLKAPRNEMSIVAPRFVRVRMGHLWGCCAEVFALQPLSKMCSRPSGMAPRVSGAVTLFGDVSSKSRPLVAASWPVLVKVRVRLTVDYWFDASISNNCTGLATPILNQLKL
jgi:hypothetical protein